MVSQLNMDGMATQKVLSNSMAALSQSRPFTLRIVVFSCVGEVLNMLVYIVIVCLRDQANRKPPP